MGRASPHEFRQVGAHPVGGDAGEGQDVAIRGRIRVQPVEVHPSELAGHLDLGFGIHRQFGGNRSACHAASVLGPPQIGLQIGQLDLQAKHVVQLGHPCPLHGSGLLDGLAHPAQRIVGQAHVLLGQQQVVGRDPDSGDRLLGAPPERLLLQAAELGGRPHPNEDAGIQQRLFGAHRQVPEVVRTELHRNEVALRRRGVEYLGREKAHLGRHVPCIRGRQIQARIHLAPRFGHLSLGNPELIASIENVAAALHHGSRDRAQGDGTIPEPVIGGPILRARRPGKEHESDSHPQPHPDTGSGEPASPAVMLRTCRSIHATSSVAVNATSSAPPPPAGSASPDGRPGQPMETNSPRQKSRHPSPRSR